MNKKIISLVLVVLVAWNIILSINLYEQNKSQNNGINVINNEVSGFSTDLTRVAANVKASLVGVESGSLSGSGFIYQSDDNYTYIITANHVLEGDSVIVTFANNISYEATILGRDAKADIAVLVLTPGFVAPALKCGDAAYLSGGEFLLSFGYYGQEDLSYSISLALLSDNATTLLRHMAIENAVIRYYGTYLSFTSTINPGISGGPLVNMAGEVVALNLMTLDDEEGLLIALPINEIELIADNIINGAAKEKVEYGIKGQAINTMANYEKVALGIGLDVVSGYYVEEILPEALAYLAGVRSGDVILSINNVAIDSYMSLLDSQYSDAEVHNFVIWRDGQNLNLSQRLEND